VLRRGSQGASLAVAVRCARALLESGLRIDPEEAYVAAISSCHMLTYLSLACRQGFQVDSYHDEAVGVLTKNDRSVPWVSAVTLHPQIAYSGDKLPAPADEERLHLLAHEQCFIANSIKTAVAVSGSKHEH
jgi:organic hydroperoxide reductase OsmC/OhrA